MPQLDLTDREIKDLWLLLDGIPDSRPLLISLFEKVYRAYRGMPPKAA